MPSAARRRAFWARWSCCSKKESALEAGKSFASFFKSCGVWGPLRPGGTLPSGRPSREADRPSRKPFAQDRKRAPKGNAWMSFLFACAREPERTPIAPLGRVRVSLLVLSHRLRRPARSRDSVSRSASFLSRKLGKELPPASGAFFYYLHSLYTFAPWVGNVAASFPSTDPWSWWLHSSRAV